MAKNVLITGASKGIGFATARRLGGLSYRVWLGARDNERGETAAKSLRENGHDVHFVRIAVDDDASVRDAAERVAQADGKLDLLINNAGIPATTSTRSTRVSTTSAVSTRPTCSVRSA